MFKNLTINLTGPICQCEENDLRWNITINYGIEIFCNTCYISVIVPIKTLKAHFQLDEQYPKGFKNKKQNENAKVLQIVPKDKE